MFGTFLNAGAVLLGGVIGITCARQISPANEFRLKVLVGVLTSYAGITMTWRAINGTFFQVCKQLIVVLLALIIGNIIGKALHLQAALNRAGGYAKRQLTVPEGGTPNRFAEGFTTCTLLFCVGPMAILGALQDGLSGSIRILAIKSIMDGLSTIAFVKTFGWGVILAVVPLLLYQGGITLAARQIEPFLHNQALLDSVNATGGLLLLCVSLIIFQLHKVPLADYLPSLAVAPLLTWLWR